MHRLLLLLLPIFLIPACASPPPEPFVIDVAHLESVHDDLPLHERADQIADWVVYGTLMHGIDDASALQKLLYDRSPIRTGLLDEVMRYDYGPGRAVAVSDEALWLFVSAHDPHPIATLGRLADRHVTETGKRPTQVEVFTYRSVLTEGLVEVVRSSVSVDDLYGEAYGRVEATVRGPQTLATWLEQIDDVVEVELEGSTLYVAGRRYPDHRTDGLALEDVAALYQAHVELARQQGQVERRIKEAADEILEPHEAAVDAFNALVRRFNDFNGASLDTKDFDEAMTQIHRRVGGAVDWPARASATERAVRASGYRGGVDPIGRTNKALLERLDAELAAVREPLTRAANQAMVAVQLELAREGKLPPGEPGFSLDPVWDAEALVADLRQADRDLRPLVARARAEVEALEARGTPRNAEPHALDPSQTFASFGSAIEFTAASATRLRAVLAAVEGKTGKELEDGAIVPLLEWREALRTADLPDLKALALLEYLHARHRYQCARYDGPLEGTRVGMVLFYTDLLAKLWQSVDYYGSAPVGAVPGFVSNPNDTPELEPLYWEEMWRLPSTRLWFGSRPEGMSSTDDHIWFAPIATRVYAAGSNPLDPGQETRPAEG